MLTIHFFMYILRAGRVQRIESEERVEAMSLHDRILKDVEKKIVTGVWPPGHRIPFETDMAKEYGCSRMTVNKALTQLSHAGLLERNKKWGTFVKAPQTPSAALEITNIQKEVEDAGKTYSYRLLEDRMRGAEEHETTTLNLSCGAEVRELRCVHYANGEPFCFEERIVNVAVAPEIRSVTFEDISPGAWMFKHVPWNNAEHQIIAAEATVAVADILNMPVGSACLIVERKTQNEKGFVTWARLSYAGCQHRLVATFSPTR